MSAHIAAREKSAPAGALGPIVRFAHRGARATDREALGTAAAPGVRVGPLTTR